MKTTVTALAAATVLLKEGRRFNRPYGLDGTPPRRHKITDRHARKVAARKRVRDNWTGEARLYKFWGASFRHELDRVSGV